MNVLFVVLLFVVIEAGSRCGRSGDPRDMSECVMLCEKMMQLFCNGVPHISFIILL